MHKLNPHTLFSIFEQGDEEIYREHKVDDVLNNPYVLIGMVVTGVDNFHLLDKMYLLKHEEEYKKVRDDVKLKYFNRLCRYLTRVDVNDIDDIYNIGVDYELDKSIDYIGDMLYFYESIEYYEKCSIIKNFLDLLIDKKLETVI